MAKKRILITAGPTREKIDSIRYISNKSTGILGHEIALEAKKRGYAVTLILGPTQLPAISGVKTIHIESAKELQQAVKKNITNADILFMTSAVADFTPKVKQYAKIKRTDDLTVRLKKTDDILKSISSTKIKGNKLYVGFCLETSHLIKNAKGKLISKNLDHILATKYTNKKPPFGQNTFDPVLISKTGEKKTFPNASKKDIAIYLINHLLKTHK